MNRRQKIIISVTGIFIVMLILVGLTYAYFLTQITGNTKEKSISVTTANLVLNYGDGNGVLEAGDKLRPGQAVNFKTSNGTTVNEKTFTVTNSGDDTSYVVIVDNVTVSPEPFESNDFKYTLTCTSSDSNICGGTTDSIFPLKNQSILVGNKIAAGTTHTYTLTMEYKETGENQSNDMGKTFTARINIEDIRRLDNPYKDNTNSLAYNIIENTKTNKNGTLLVNNPPSKVAEEINSKNWDLGAKEILYFDEQVSGYADSEEELFNCYYGYINEETGEFVYDCSGVTDYYTSCTEAVETKYIFGNGETAYVYNCENEKFVIGTVKPEKVLSLAIDDYGTSYYYRGDVEDNYVTFAGMCWRIVRIAGDGSVKIVLEDQDEACSTSMNGNWGIPTTTGGTTYTGNYGYEEKNVDSDSDSERIMSYLKPVDKADKSMARAFYDFQKDKLEDYKSKLKSGNWCLADKAYTQSGSYPNYTYTLLEEYNYSSSKYYYDAYTRLTSGNANGYQPTLKCTGTIMDKFESVTYNETEIIEEAPMYVSALTADEMVYAGGKVYSEDGNNYLLNENFKSGNAGYYYFWSLSPSYFIGNDDYAFCLNVVGSMLHNNVYNDRAFRPAVSLASSAVISEGEGTLESPYVIG